jgi:acyl-CoA thioesterase II
MGNAANISYGGFTIGVGVEAACSTVSPDYYLYTVMGNYLGPAFTDRKIQCTVRRLRDTRTFATREVILSQEAEDGSQRPCMSMLLDFQAREQASMLVFSAPPTKTYSRPENCKDRVQIGQELVEKKLIPEELVELHSIMFGLMNRLFDSRLPLEGVSAHNLSGLAGKVETGQEHLSITDKTSADWFRARHKPESGHGHYSALAFIMDSNLSFLPLTHNGMSLYDSGPCSSLDFAMRFFTNDLDVSKWHLRELRCVVGQEGRTYSESRLWDEAGNMVANMTQQSILRPKPTKDTNRASL